MNNIYGGAPKVNCYQMLISSF